MRESQITMAVKEVNKIIALFMNYTETEKNFERYTSNGTGHTKLSTIPKDIYTKSPSKLIPVASKMKKAKTEDELLEYIVGLTEKYNLANDANQSFALAKAISMEICVIQEKEEQEEMDEAA